ncbi:MAG: hypothetical protein M3340_07510 [Actinomycetota bacterium]|nr:hypothetical protein [Actinomycetota bacterium]
MAVVLLLIALALSIAADLPVLALVVVPFLVGIAATELDANGEAMGRALVRLAAFALPRRVRSEYLDQWIDHVLCAEEASDHGIRPLMVGASILFLAAPLLAVLTRFGSRGTMPVPAADHLEEVSEETRLAWRDGNEEVTVTHVRRIVRRRRGPGPL